MEDKDQAEFAELMTATMELYGKSDQLSSRVLSMWWHALNPYPLAGIRTALDQHISESKWSPMPADIIERLQQSDGRPGEEEAWAVASQAGDESVTLIWTEETAQAWGAAQPLLENGDEIGARMAFKEKYAKLVSEARQRGDAVNVTISPGRDPQRREEAIQDAYGRNLISHDRATRMLGRDPEDTPSDQLPSPGEQLARLRDDSGMTAEQQEQVRQHLEDMRAQLKNHA